MPPSEPCLEGRNTKVLLTHERFLPDFGGGGESIVYRTACELRNRGVQVTVLTTGDASAVAYDGIRTVRLPISRHRLNLAVREIAKHASPADLIHTFNYHAALPSRLAGLLTGKPVVCEILGLFGPIWKEMKGRWRGMLYNRWEKFLVRQAFAKMLFLSEYSRRMAISMGADPSRCVTNSPGVDLTEFRPCAKKEDFVLFVGKLEARKGIHNVVAAANALPHVPFVVSGWGPEESWLKNSAPENLQYIGYCSGPPLRDWYARARIFFFPSKVETFGLVMAEAMASGCAVVSSVPLEFKGVLHNREDLQAMIEGIELLWENQDLCHTMGQQNVLLARAFNWQRYGDTLISVYRGILERGIEAGHSEAASRPLS
jgi:glycosyltransferase involved in cell wall biosynthesis